MAPIIYFENHHVNGVDDDQASSLKQRFSQLFGVASTDFYITVNGKRVSDDFDLLTCEYPVRIHSKLVGGKGGFGSMLRAIGAQIEKTTNREACRDLSGRRLRDINEEKRLRKWLEGQADREREAAERKLKKLERLVAEPKIDVNLNDSAYEKERQELPERVSAAVDAGWEACASESAVKRKSTEVTKQKNKKKAKLWIDADLSECSSTDSEGDEGKPCSRITVSTDSGNESDRISEASAPQ